MQRVFIKSHIGAEENMNFYNRNMQYLVLTQEGAVTQCLFVSILDLVGVFWSRG